MRFHLRSRASTTWLLGIAATLVASLGVVGTPTTAHAADALVYNQAVADYGSDGTRDGTASFSLAADPLGVSVSPSVAGLTAASAGECRRITASSKYVAPVGTLWTFTSGAVYCFKRGAKITYFQWETPDGHVTKAGQLAGWQYTGNDQWKNHISPCKLHGESTGHFKQTYPFGVGTIARQDAPQDVIVNCNGGINWS